MARRGQVLDWTPRRYGAEPSNPPNPNLPPGPNRMVTGIIARNKAKAQSCTPGIVHNVVLERDWRQLQTVSLGPLSVSGMASLVADLDWAYSQGYKVRLRIYAGVAAPSDLCTGADGIPTWWSNTGPVPGGAYYNIGPLPMWWRPAYLAAYSDFQSRLATASISGSTTGAVTLATHPAFAEITMACTAVSTGEPFIKGLTYQPNLDIILAITGSQAYSSALDIAGLQYGSTVHGAVWTPLGVGTYFPFNPYQKLTGTTTAIDVTTTLAIMDDFVTKVGRCAVVANNSFMYPTGALGANYDTMYAAMAAYRARSNPWPVPMAFQSSTEGKFEQKYATDGNATINSSLTQAIAWGATGVEMPNGSDTAAAPFQLTPTFAANANALFDANAVPLH